jgi:DTW domain-containing protein YfiP
MCYRCRRVQNLCVCGIVRGVVGDTPVRNRLGITILQDRKEALRRPFGSAIVCELALENCVSVWYDTKIPEHVPMPDHLIETKGVGVLFPGPGARRLRRRKSRNETENTENTKRGKSSVETLLDDEDYTPPNHLIVIDTTWHRARRMYARIPWIKNLPAYVLGESTPLIKSGDASFDERGERKTSGHINESGSGPKRGGVETEEKNHSTSPSTNEGEGVRSESGYRIRKQPKPGFLSTAECVAAALREGEPDDEEAETETVGDAKEGDKKTSGATRGALAAEAVEKCFDAMIDAQVRSFSDRKNVRYRSRKAERAAKEAAAGAGGREAAEQTVPASA